MQEVAKTHKKEKGNMYPDKDFEISLDYIAGFFDGEGNVTIKVSYDKRKKYKTFFGGRIQIVQTNQEILRKIASFLGYGYVRERNRENKKWKTLYTLEIQNEKECRNFIDKMRKRTYRKIKQLLLLEEFYNERANRKNYHIYSKNNALKYIEIAERMQLLNDNNKVTEHLLKVKREIEAFDEKAYLEKMKKMYEERGKKTKEYMERVRKIRISKDKLEELYLKQKFNCPEIAKIYNCHKVTIARRLKEYGIPIRQQIIKISKKELIKLYLNEKLSCVQIAKRFNCHQRTIIRKLDKYKIPRRKPEKQLSLWRERKIE